MRRMTAGSGIVFTLSLCVLVSSIVARPASAEEAVKEGRSVGTCSEQVLVCAFLKDGTMKPTSECQARQEKTVRVLPGDCYDAD